MWKKLGMLRLILDARRANRRFRRAPRVKLLTGEGISRIECADDVGALFVGCGDVKDAFHNMLIPAWLGKYFCLPAVAAKTVGLGGKWLEGKLLLADSPVWAYPCSLPMGFGWSLYLCQDTTEFQSEKVDFNLEVPLICDDEPAPVLSRD